jgi:peroxiredoxin Q/BCP
MSFKKIMVAVLVLAFAMILPSAGRAAAGNIPSVGTEAPDFQLKAQDGKLVRLKDLRGKWVVLYFYPRDFTSGCTLEAHSFEQDLTQYQAMNAEVLGVSVDSSGSHKSFCAKEGLNFKLLSDADHKVSQEYGSTREMNGTVMAARNTFVIDPAGKIAKTFIGVHPDHHSTEVTAALRALQK